MEQVQGLDLIEHDLKSKYSSVVVVQSNAAALKYNRSIRERLWGDANMPVQVRDTLLVNRNCAVTKLRNGDLVIVLEVDPDTEMVTVPRKGSSAVTLNFRSATVAYREYDGTVVKNRCFVLENLLQSPNRELSALEQRALLVHFRNRHPRLHVKSDEFRSNYSGIT